MQWRGKGAGEQTDWTCGVWCFHLEIYPFCAQLSVRKVFARLKRVKATPGAAAPVFFGVIAKVGLGWVEMGIERILVYQLQEENGLAWTLIRRVIESVVVRGGWGTMKNLARGSSYFN